MSGPLRELFDASGNLFVLNNTGNNVTEYQPPYTSVLHTFGSGAETPNPTEIALDSKGDLYIGTSGGTVGEFSSGGSVVRAIAINPGGISALALDSNDNLYVPDVQNNLVDFFGNGTATIPSSGFSTGINDPVALVSWP